MAVYKRGDIWWYKFVWNGESIRESTKQGNKRVAEQMEAARRTALAKGEVGIRDRVKAPTLRAFAKDRFLPSVATAKRATKRYYEYGVKSLLTFPRLADAPLDKITSEDVAAYAEYRRRLELEVSSVNRELQALRRMFRLAAEWGAVEKALPTVRMLSGEKHRERVLTGDEEKRYFEAAAVMARDIEDAYQKALEGIRAVKRGQQPRKPDAFLLRDVVRLLLDCALRPEECFRLRRENVANGKIEVLFGKTSNARRRIPMTPAVAAIIEMRLERDPESPWLFPAPTQSGHIEPSSLKKQHAKACADSGVAAFELYVCRHTCLTRWAPFMDAYTLGYLAGHSDMNITKRYVHVEERTVLAAMEKARGGHKSGHSTQNANLEHMPVSSQTV